MTTSDQHCHFTISGGSHRSLFYCRISALSLFSTLLSLCSLTRFFFFLLLYFCLLYLCVFFIPVFVSSLFLPVVCIPYLCPIFSSVFFFLPYFCLFLCLLYLHLFCISVILLSPLFLSCSLLILYSFPFFITVSSLYLCFLSLYRGLLFSLLYRFSFSMSSSLSFSFLCSSFTDLHNKTCDPAKSVITLAMRMTVCATPWTLILRHQLWVRFAALAFSYESRRSDLKFAPDRRWCCKGQNSFSSYTSFPHVRDEIRCRHIEPLHATCKFRVATDKDIHVCIAGSNMTMFKLKRPSGAPDSLVVMQNGLQTLANNRKLE